MKVELNLKELKGAMGKVQKLKQRTALPVLKMVRLVAVNLLELEATNLDLACSVEVEASVDSGGVVLVDGGLLQNALARGGKDDRVMLERKGDFLEIVLPVGTYTLPLFPVDDWPHVVVPDADDAPVAQWELPAADLMGGAASVVGAMGNDAMRGALCGICLLANDDGLALCATDGRRAAERKLACGTVMENMDGVEPGWVIPAPGVDLLRMMTAADAGDVVLRVWPGKAWKLIGDTWWVVGKLFDGRYPIAQLMNILRGEKERGDWRSVIVEEMIAHLAAANVVLAKESRSVQVRGSERALEFLSTGPVARYEGQVPAKGGPAGEQVVGLNPELLIGLLQGAPEASVTLSLGDGLQPVLLRDGHGWTAVLMPLRIS